MSYMTDDEKRMDEMVRKSREAILSLGYGHAMPVENIAKSEEKLRRSRKRSAIIGNIMSCLRTIIYTPLSVAFHAVSFVTKGIGYISSLGLIAAAFYVYQAFTAFKSGTPFGEIDVIGKAATLIAIPFIAYAVSVITEHIYEYFENNAF